MYISKMNRIPIVVFTMFVLFVLTGTVNSQSSSDEEVLYDRLGGLASISVVVSDFMDDFMADPLFFENPAVRERKTPESKPYIRYHLISMVCQATGGPCEYTGVDMREAHDGLNISDREWNRMVKIFAATLEKHNVPEQETRELFEILGSTKDYIVVME